VYLFLYPFATIFIQPSTIFLCLRQFNDNLYILQYFLSLGLLQSTCIYTLQYFSKPWAVVLVCVFVSSDTGCVGRVG
jgi:hypothetical protein